MELQAGSAVGLPAIGGYLNGVADDRSLREIDKPVRLEILRMSHLAKGSDLILEDSPLCLKIVACCGGCDLR
jgi:hypothetical protein